MDYALTREDSRRADEFTIQTLGLPGIVLMENAGRITAEVVREILDERGGITVYVLAGKGNNGGDGFVIARYLLEWGVNVHTFQLAADEEYSGDAAKNLTILSQLTDSVYHTRDVDALDVLTTQLLAADVIVDALLGTGIQGAPRSPFDEFINWINNYNAPTVSVDIPSGVDANTGQLPGMAVAAEATVTMGYLKTGLLFSPGREFTGEITIADIGIPGSALDLVENVYSIPEQDDIHYRLPQRSADVYKHRVGKVFTLCGAPGFTGAATLVSEGALVAGAGLIMAGVPKSLNNILETKLTEVITVPLEESAKQTFSSSSLPALQEHFEWSDVLAIGPGMTRESDVQKFIGKVLTSYGKVAVVDADAATYFSGDHLQYLKECPADIILTPHWGEFGKISGYNTEDLNENRLEIAEKFARQHNVTLVLKGAPTIIAAPTGEVFINPTGNAGMATGGSGDVLTGVIAGLVAQKLKPKDAAVVGCYLHGLAGDFAREELTEMGLTAGALLDFLPDAMEYILNYYDYL